MQHERVWTDEVAGAANAAFNILIARAQRLQDTGLLGTRSVGTAVNAYHALCEGLVIFELRCRIPAEEAERFWQEARLLGRGV